MLALVGEGRLGLVVDLDGSDPRVMAGGWVRARAGDSPRDDGVGSVAGVDVSAPVNDAEVFSVLKLRPKGGISTEVETPPL